MQEELIANIIFYFCYSYSFQTVVLKGLGKDITKKHIYKKVRKAGEVKEVIYPVITKAPEAAEGEQKGEDQVEEGTGESWILFIAGSFKEDIMRFKRQNLTDWLCIFN